MTENTRMNLNVDGDVPGMLAELAGGQRRMGQYLSDLIRQIHAGQVDVGKPGELEALTNAIRHLSLKVKELDARVGQIEDKP